MTERALRRLAALCLAAAAAAAHAGPLDELPACLEAEDFERCLALADTLEARHGRSPRIESARAIALDQLRRPLLAYRSLLVYTALTRQAALSDDPAHQALTALRDRLQAELARELAARKGGLDAERQQAAEAAIAPDAARQAARAQERQRAHQGTSQRLLLQAYVQTPDKAAFEARMKAEGVDASQLKAQVAAAATATAASSKATLGELLSGFAGRPLPFHVLPHAVTDGMASYTLQTVSVSGFTIDYTATARDARGRELKESGTVQGLDLAKLRRYDSRTEGDRTVHLFEFDQPLIWRRGNARYADGSPFDGELTSFKGERQLRLLSPAADGERIAAQIRTLVDAAKTQSELK